MPPNQRTRKAYKAMKDIGIDVSVVKPVLNDLLKLYDRKWAHIEAENYRVLADAIFEMKSEVAQNKESENSEQGPLEEETLCKESEKPLKRLQSKHQDDQPSLSCDNSSSTLAGASFKKPKVKCNDVSGESCPSVLQGMVASHQLSHGGREAQTPSASYQTYTRSKGKEPILPKPMVLPDKSLPTQPAGADRNQTNVLRKAKAGPKPSSHPMRLRDRQRKPQTLQPARDKTLAPGHSSHVLHLKEPKTEACLVLTPQQKMLTAHDFIKPKDEPFTDDAPHPEVPIAVIPSESLYKDDVPSVNGLLKDHSASENLAADSSGAMDGTYCIATSSSEMKTNQQLIQQLSPPCNGVDDRSLPEEDASGNNHCKVAENGQSVLEEMNSQSPEVVESLQVSHDNTSSLNEGIDITKGQEKIAISVVNEVNSEHPPSFQYIPQNTVFQNAYVNISLARIGDDHSCSTCSGDCLSLSVPCACAYETGGEFAYTEEGLVKEEFLKECISMNRDPGKHCQFYCTECPLERSKNDNVIEPCKGHLVRNFIKECWRKCGCNIQCGNRVVQRGISRKLQVFMTPGGKGWGLRSLEDLPRGAFVCEYVGEVLTNAELFERVSRGSSSEEHSYPVLLDADWAAEGVLKDEEALCLDATYYGNVARFINHRCFDSNLVEIPVEIETPDHHYYHLAFFTTRKVKAMEELTWDYGIDFDDVEHPIKAFKCQCGSRFCRNGRRSSRSRSKRRR
ncbi:histone-lysine N-methyltransferase SUVR4-like isoform X2 [Ipomoea triloba]|uniref:histone-lysine N-methyltransferase SUVR4-like isoform X2 n=1 Tax=Ipomoea triloba TaxID=35885 RepID=UPI00125D2AAC|nr:histone-lysine N-methyltransferase SUVR4-like isoform X2 [Ipomoea triloba]XP_031121914.1 histone-lysine N-methyltransferase SUVR4-like isoform X2 [Ipomoea triloba]XP_031121915.1 histone-lysine N-methyltransferase SUVR4-like isoform X2 [Ipomoea triloba]XP_031121917.1 histone-lysine N-methyltransferase SUVR4-like isoform X2 [Ipomoea triloba]XP_031121918.1 histone-lysine N-methyltransferase SUVR4-like isoform X2 [Ipomoea triloba]